MTNPCEHILVPLDGSELAETAVINAVDLAELNHADVTLLQVMPHAQHVIGVNTPYPYYLDQQEANRKAEILLYLDRVKERMVQHDLVVHLEVATGEPAEAIIDYTHKHPVDLVIMTTHGRSGLKRWVYGSVADEVLHGANLPVLMCIPDKDQLH